jgi:hypothetical protein
MKKRRILAGILILILLALFTNWALRQKLSQVSSLSTNDSTSFSNVNQSASSSTAAPTRKQWTSSEMPSPHSNDTSGNPVQVEHKIEEMFKTPIEFYGRVVDENKNPVAGADISFSWNKLTVSHQFETGQSNAKTDENGLFSLEGQNGEGLDVRVSKSGYYTAKSNTMSFRYSQLSGMPIYVPDRNNPVIFFLVKKGSGVSLVTSKNGMGDDFSILVSRDGTPLKVDLLHRMTGEGPLEITQTKPDPKLMNQATEWSFQMAIPDGGFVEYHDQDFPVEAPDTNYQSTVQFDFQKSQTNWTETIAKDFYIRFSNPPLYGRLHVETSIGGGVRLTYAINPDGSRNIEAP